jgi:hypothetical protein
MHLSIHSPRPLRNTKNAQSQGKEGKEEVAAIDPLYWKPGHGQKAQTQ